MKTKHSTVYFIEELIDPEYKSYACADYLCAKFTRAAAFRFARNHQSRGKIIITRVVYVNSRRHNRRVWLYDMSANTVKRVE